MKTFNQTIKLITEEEEDFDPMASGDISGAEHVNKFYHPTSHHALEKDPDLPNQNMPAINHAEYRAHLHRIWEQKFSMLIYGRPGVGKSFQVEDFMKELADRGIPKKSDPSEKREFQVFNKADPQKQRDILRNPGDYVVLVDVRAASFEPSDFIGIPTYDDEGQYTVDRDNPATEDDMEHLRTVKYKWAYLVTHPDTSGMLFLDEVNQAEPDVLSAMFMVVLDRVIFDQPISDNVAVMAAGNLVEHDEKSENLPIPKALSRRFQQGGVATLVADPDEWLEWAAKDGVHPAILSFVMSNKSKAFYTRPEGDNDRFPDPDSLRALSKYMYNIDHRIFDYTQTLKEYDRVARSVVGHGWATDFLVFLKGKEPDKLMKLNNLKNLPAHEKWMVTHFLQKSVTEAYIRDPLLKEEETLGILKYAAEAIKGLPQQMGQSFSHLIQNHRNEKVQEGYMMMKTKLDEVKKAKPVELGVYRTIEQGLQYTSEFEKYSNESEETNLLQVNHKNLIETLEHGWEERDPVLVYGDPGIGKSWAVKQFAKTKAKELDLPFVDLNIQANQSERMKAARSPGKVFLFLDVRVAAMTPADFMGLPQVFDAKTPYLLTQKYFWAWAVTQPNAIGILFFDEINQAQKQVLKAMYSVINPSDRFIFDRHMSEDIMVIGAGNLASQESVAERDPLPAALNRRFKAGTVVLKLDANEWLEWARNQDGENKIHPVILHFISSRDNPYNYIFNRSEGENEPDLTPDTLRTLSSNLYYLERKFDERQAEGMKLEENIQQFTKDWRAVVKVAIPMWWGSEFLDFLFKYKRINWDDLVQKSKYFGDPIEMRKKAKELGDESLLDLLMTAMPFLQSKMKLIQQKDPGYKHPKTRQRVKEMIEVFSNFNLSNTATFVSYLDRTGTRDAFQTFLTPILKAGKGPEIAQTINNAIQTLQAGGKLDQASKDYFATLVRSKLPDPVKKAAQKVRDNLPLNQQDTNVLLKFAQQQQQQLSSISKGYDFDETTVNKAYKLFQDARKFVKRAKGEI